MRQSVTKIFPKLKSLSRMRDGGMLASGFLFAAALSGQIHAATNVPASSNLATILNASTTTTTDHDFNLLGNVTLG
ncbi:MAG: hypothetical protein LBV28_05405, partial [Puniceicoccales bacterium]|nr:hypothetical protein [Puniceicoccales bacterium]